MSQLFELGSVVITRGASEDLKKCRAVVENCLKRHSLGDWGNVCKEDKASNDEGVTKGYRLMSEYQYEGVKFWIITEADRSVTTILLPEEY